jgi:hypothetical protein
VLGGAGSRIELAASGIEIRSDTVLELLGGAAVEIDSAGTATMRAGGVLRLNPSSSCAAVARVGDQVAGSATPAGTVSGVIVTGSPNVCVG